MTKRRPPGHTRDEASRRARSAFGTLEAAGIAWDGNPYPDWVKEDDRVPATYQPCTCELDEWEIAPAFYLSENDLIQCWLCAGRVMCPTGRHGAMFCDGPDGPGSLAWTDIAVETFFKGLMDAEYPLGLFPRGLYLGCKTCCRQRGEGCPWVTWDGTPVVDA